MQLVARSQMLQSIKTKKYHSADLLKSYGRQWIGYRVIASVVERDTIRYLCESSEADGKLIFKYAKYQILKQRARVTDCQAPTCDRIRRIKISYSKA